MVAMTTQATGRSRVLDAAAELFVAQGYSGTTLRQIAATAGIKAGSVYHHFDSKEALYVAVLSEGMVVMTDAFAAAQDQLATDADVSIQLLAHVRAHLGAVFEHGPYTTAHVSSFSSAPESVRTQVVPERDHYERMWSALFDRCFPALSAQELRLHRLILFGAMNAACEWFRQDGDFSLDQLSAAISNQFLNGVT